MVSEEDVQAFLEASAKEPRPPAVSPQEIDACFESIDWEHLVGAARKENGLDAVALAAALTHLQRPFEKAEAKELLELGAPVEGVLNPFARFEGAWPRSWLSFLQWSNGLRRGGEQHGFSALSLREVRENTVGYGVAHLMVGAVPVAIDLVGTLALFDTRKKPDDGEYPIVLRHCTEVHEGWGVPRPRSASSFRALWELPWPLPDDA